MMSMLLFVRMSKFVALQRQLVLYLKDVVQVCRIVLMLYVGV